MKSFSAREYQAKHTDIPRKDGATGRDYTLARVRRFQEADQSLKQACAELGIEKPIMMC
ncbi:hypothetical protein [Pseudomonas protegens]|uniref:hypothetical protein n=1 Tax=Pseudomonas protegens TaxID=380021 RepID=UPI00215DE52D|nr:hypothetical protein [Pseudomonas protegens]UVL73839.1 hypothetical protein LOY23_06265 [Pseudomonas protegens]